MCQPHLIDSILHACSLNNEKLYNIILSVIIEKTDPMCLTPKEKIYKSKTVPYAWVHIKYSKEQHAKKALPKVGVKYRVM